MSCSTDQNFTNLIAAIRDACAAYVAAASQTPAAAPAAPVAQAAAQPAAPVATTPAVDPAAAKAAFASEARAILQRHGGAAGPVAAVAAQFNVTKPADQLNPDQYGPFLAAMRAAYGEV
jgi:hypothetical protein